MWIYLAIIRYLNRILKILKNFKSLKKHIAPDYCKIKYLSCWRLTKLHLSLIEVVCALPASAVRAASERRAERLGAMSAGHAARSTPRHRRRMLRALPTTPRYRTLQHTTPSASHTPHPCVTSLSNEMKRMRNLKNRTARQYLLFTWSVDDKVIPFIWGTEPRSKVI